MSIRWSLYITRRRRAGGSWDQWLIPASCYPSVFGLDWDKVRTKMLLSSYTRNEKGSFTNDGDIIFTGEGLLYFASFHKDAAERVPALRQWLELQEAVESIKGSAV